MALAQALVVVEGKEPHFSQQAQDFLCALIMYECRIAREEKRRPLFSNIRLVATQRYPEGKFMPDSAVGLVKAIAEMTVMGDPVITSKAQRYLEVNKETQGVMATLIGQTSILDEPVIANDLDKGDFDFRSMKSGGVKTVYLTLPAPRLDSHAKWLRLVLSAALNALSESTPSEEGNTVLFLLDEFANLGKLEKIETAVRLMRGYGVQIWPIVQDLNQLNDKYGKAWETFFGNCEVITSYGCRDNFTQKYLSENLGKKTEHVMGLSGGEQPGGDREGWNIGQHSEPLLHPDDFGRFPRRDMLVWMYPHNPFFTHSPLYSGMGTEWALKLKPNPYAPKFK
jgi:type IV secretion system protein VirD4